MDFTKEELDEFKKIMKEDYGENLSDKEVYRLASKVITLFNILHQPIPNKK